MIGSNIRHFRFASPYAPCGARFREATKRKPSNYATDTYRGSVTCETCQQSAPYARQAIIDLPFYDKTFVRIGHEVYKCADPSRCSHRYIGLQYRMLCYRTGEFDSPQGGDSWSYGDWEETSPEEATHLIVPYTGWSDYSGSTVERSNNRALRNYYPDTFTLLYGGHGTEELALPLNWRPPADGREGLLDALAGLPLYDEQDESMLVQELADEAWDTYLDYDVPRRLAELSPSSEATEDMLEAIAETDAYANTCYGPREQHERATLRNMFYEAMSAVDSYPESESATDVIFRDMDGIIEELSRALWELRCASLPRIPAWFNPAQAILPGMPIARIEDIRK
jgi:hypothetical protein